MPATRHSSPAYSWHPALMRLPHPPRDQEPDQDGGIRIHAERGLGPGCQTEPESRSAHMQLSDHSEMEAVDSQRDGQREQPGTPEQSPEEESPIVHTF